MEVLEINGNFYTIAENGYVLSLSNNKNYKFPKKDEFRLLKALKLGSSKILLLDQTNIPLWYDTEAKIFDPKNFVWRNLKVGIKREYISAIEYMGMVRILGGQKFGN